MCAAHFNSLPGRCSGAMSNIVLYFFFYLEAGRVRWTSRTAVVATAAGTCMFGIIIQTIQCMVPAMLASTNVHLSAIAASTAAVDDGIVEQLFLNRFDVHEILKILWLLFYRSQYIHINNLLSLLLEEISRSLSLNQFDNYSL